MPQAGTDLFIARSFSEGVIMKTRRNTQNTYNTLPLALAFAAGFTTSASSFAQPADGPGGFGGEHRRGPPPEAVAACKGKAADAVCSFTGREGQTLNGTCFAPPPRAEGADKAGAPERPPACRPDRGSRPPAGDKPKG
jgi:hypothetical protein